MLNGFDWCLHDYEGQPIVARLFVSVKQIMLQTFNLETGEIEELFLKQVNLEHFKIRASFYYPKNLVFYGKHVEQVFIVNRETFFYTRTDGVDAPVRSFKELFEHYKGN